jgi:hypothetical protein
VVVLVVVVLFRVLHPLEREAQEPLIKVALVELVRLFPTLAVVVVVALEPWVATLQEAAKSEAMVELVSLLL